MAILVLAVGLAAGAASAQQEAKLAITQIVGDLYRFQNNFHFSVFLVTPEGVIATDPINVDAAAWREAEIAERFGQPVKYLIYSHDHTDDIAGGEVFADTATIVAHDNAKRTIIGEKRPTAVPQVTFSDRMTIELGGKQDVADNRRHLEDLHAAVLAGLWEGNSVEDLRKSIALEAYADWGQYEVWRPLNIQGMAANIAPHRRGN